MSATNTFETALLQHIFQNADIALIGDASGLLGSAVDGNLYVSLHTGNPDETGDQTTNECNYTSYARVAVSRTAGWDVTGNLASNAAEVTFPGATGGSNTATYVGIGTASSGAGFLLCSFALENPLAISDGVTPSFPAGDVYTSLD